MVLASRRDAIFGFDSLQFVLRGHSRQVVRSKMISVLSRSSGSRTASASRSGRPPTMAVSAHFPRHGLLLPIRSTVALDRADSRLLWSMQNPGSTCRASLHIVPEGKISRALRGLATDG
jgi:hypothetical protein